MQRVSLTQLEILVKRINEATGMPVTPYTRVNNVTVANVGNYHIDEAYGGVSLCQMSDMGGVYTILERSTKRELFYQLHAFLAGMATMALQRKVKS